MQEDVQAAGRRIRQPLRVAANRCGPGLGSEVAGRRVMPLEILGPRYRSIFRAYRRAMPLKPGDKAPDFTLLDQNGEPFSLSKSRKAKKVWHLIYFYPKETRS